MTLACAPRSLVIATMLLVAWCTRVLAAEPDATAAETLFHEGRALIQEGHVDAACEKFAESQRRDQSSGTLINLAACHERQGKLAEALAEYRSTIDLARRQGRGRREAEARRKAAELEALIASESGATPITIPPAETAEPAAAESTAARPASQRPPSSPPAPSSTDHATAPTSERPKSVLGWVLIGTGAAAVVTGGAFGVAALSSYAHAEKNCPFHEQCPQSAIDAGERAFTYSTVADVGFGVGAAAIIAGVWLVVATPSSDRRARTAPVRVVARAVPRSASIAVEGAF